MPNKYTPSQVTRMVINPFCPGNVLEAYPFLAAMVPPDTFGVDLNKYFKWMAWVYDLQSPMAKDYTDFKQRQEAAANETGFKLVHEKDYRHIAMKFLQHLKNPLWALIVSYETVFWDSVEMVMTPVDGTDDIKDISESLKVLKPMNEARVTIAELRKEFFGGDEKLAETVIEDFSPEGRNRAMRKK